MGDSFRGGVIGQWPGLVPAYYRILWHNWRRRTGWFMGDRPISPPNGPPPHGHSQRAIIQATSTGNHQGNGND